MRIVRHTHYVLLLFALVTIVKSQTAPPSSTLPGIITMCEDADGCSDWFFKGEQGTGTWTSGGVADLKITHLDSTSITIHRVDPKGVVQGLIADYTGTISNGWIEGDISASWPGHSTGRWCN